MDTVSSTSLQSTDPKIASNRKIELYLKRFLEALLVIILLLYFATNCFFAELLKKHLGFMLGSTLTQYITEQCSTGFDTEITNVTNKTYNEYNQINNQNINNTENNQNNQNLQNRNETSVSENITQIYNTYLTELQNLNLNGNSLTITGGNTVNLPTFSFSDTDTNTTYSAGAGLDLNDTTFSIEASGVTAGTYGNASFVPQFTVGSDGRITSVTSVPVSGGSSSLIFQNGLTQTGDNVEFGGTLLHSTTLVNGGFDFNITGTGNVGIGTTTPTEKLHIDGNLITSGITYFGSTDYFVNSAGFATVSSANATTGSYTVSAVEEGLILCTECGAGTSSLKMTNANGLVLANTNTNEPDIIISPGTNGNVGIGTNSPLAKLHIVGGELRVQSAASGNAFVQYRNDGTNLFTINDEGRLSGGARTYVSIEDDVVVEDGGYVAIGGRSLNLHGGEGGGNISTITNGGYYDNAVWNRAFDNYLPQIKITSGNNASSFAFGASTTTTGTPTFIERMRILIDGDGSKGSQVTIGNDTPATANLDINIQDASVIGQIIKSASGQTANLQEWQTSVGLPFASVSSIDPLTTTASNYNIFNVNPNLTGVYTTGTNNIYGYKSTVTTSGVSTGGTQNTYGGHFTAVGENTGVATTNAVGFYATASGADNNYAAIFEQGNVGIGTTTPGFKLEVNGDVKVGNGSRLILGSNTTDLTGTNGAMYYNSTSNKFRCYENSVWVNCIGSGGVTGGWELTGNSGTDDTTNFLGTTDTEALVFKTNNTERMRISEDGALLVSGSTGATPTSGVGTRMMWVPSRNAFRMGTLDGNGALTGAEWDDANMGDYSFAFGLNSIASGMGDIAFGENSTATGGGAYALGYGADATGFLSVALGPDTSASSDYAVAIGQNSSASGQNSLAMMGGTANGSGDIAIGSSAITTLNGIVLGAGQADGGIVLGSGTSAPGGLAVHGGTATANSSFAMGTATIASGEYTLSLGSSNNVSNDFSVAIGNHLVSSGENSFVIGSGRFAVGENLVNNVDNSIMMGTLSDIPTFFIAPATGLGTTGQVAIGTTTNTHKLTVTDSTTDDVARFNGTGINECTIVAGTGIGCTSDERYKENIKDISNVVEKLENIRTVTYNWKDSPNRIGQIGFLAQNVEQYFPDLVRTDENGQKSVLYAQFAPLLVAGMREQQFLIDTNGDAVSVANRDIRTLSTNFGALDQNIDTLNSIVEEQSSTLNTEITSIKSELTSLSGLISSIGQKVDNSTNTIATHSAQISDVISRLDYIYPTSSGSGKLNQIEERLAFLENSLLASGGTSASGAAVLGASTSATLSSTESDVTFESLMVTGNSNMNNLTVMGNVNMGLLSVDGLNSSLDALGSALKLQSNATGNIEFIGNKIEMTQQGNLIVKEGNVEIQKGIIKANSNVRGINLAVNEGSGDIQVTFDNSRSSNKYAVSVTPSWMTMVSVSDKKETGFTIKFSQNAPPNASIDWIIID